MSEPKEHVIEELLECALINIDNIARGIPPAVARVQVEEALKMLRDDSPEEQQ